MPLSRDAVFDRVTVDHVLATGSRISWRLRTDFADPPPYTFQLQYGESGLAGADDWTDTGDPEDDVVTIFYSGDQQDFAVVPTTHFRVKLVTYRNTYYSQPVPYWGRVNRHDWINARAIIRRELLRHRVGAGTTGWLFKRRKRTPPVTNTNVVDFLTNEVINTQNTAGVGTDRLGGYFQPVLFQMDLAPDERHSHRDGQFGQIDNSVVLARAIAFPELDHGDVWASASGDMRYAVHKVKNWAHVRNMPIIVSPELRRLSASDPIYDLPLPETPPLQTLDREEF